MQPVVYRPFFNLDLCTENLGCETGVIDFSPSFVHADHEDQKERQPMNPPTRLRSRESPRTTILPPPLTTINHVKVRASREGGRLLLRAVSLPAPASMCLLAERSGGRLTLRFQGDFGFKYNQKDEFKSTQKGEGEEETGQSIEKEVSMDKEQVVFQEEKDGSSETDVNKFEDNGGGEVGTWESLPRPSRCTQSGPKNNEELPFWKLYLITTSS